MKGKIAVLILLVSTGGLGGDILMAWWKVFGFVWVVFFYF